MVEIETHSPAQGLQNLPDVGAQAGPAGHTCLWVAAGRGPVQQLHVLLPVWVLKRPSPMTSRSHVLWEPLTTPYPLERVGLSPYHQGAHPARGPRSLPVDPGLSFSIPTGPFSQGGVSETEQEPGEAGWLVHVRRPQLHSCVLVVLVWGPPLCLSWPRGLGLPASAPCFLWTHTADLKPP